MLNKIRYDWHLKRVERINTVLNTRAYHSYSEIRGLVNLRAAHIKQMDKLKEK
jgi:hypothetical protein